MPNPRSRRSPRLQGYDYSQEGAYFITICTHHREHRFGDVTNAEMNLNAFGNIAEQEWFETGKLRSEFELDAFIVMPNHVHGILTIVDNNSARTGRALSSPPQTTFQPNPTQIHIDL